MHERFAKLHQFEEHITTLIFLGGFIFDILLLPDIDDPKARFFALGYILIIGILIMFREWIVSLNKANVLERRLYAISTFSILCLLGSTLSFICIYAIRSAAFSVSWPLFLILTICIFANEFVSTHNFRLTLDIGILFIAVVFFSIFHLPVILKVQNDTTFLISIALAVTFALGYTYLLRNISETTDREAPRIFALAIGIPMFVGMLYMLNIIPAVPLSLREGGVYHNIVRTGNGLFIGDKEIDNRHFAKYRTPEYHITPNDSSIYFFSAVGAPAELSAPLSHVWEYYDPSINEWIPSNTVAFTIAGGREDGYRAYSIKNSVTEGLWRVTVKVDNKRIIGRVKFKIIKSDSVSLKKDTL